MIVGKIGETRLVVNQPARSQNIMISTVPFAALPAGFATAPRHPDNLLANCYFEYSNGASSGTNIPSGTYIADCWRIIANDDNVDFDYTSTIPEKVRVLAPHRPHRGLHIKVISQNGWAGVSSFVQGQDAIQLTRLFSSQPNVAIGMMGFGEPIVNLAGSIQFDPAGSGDPSQLSTYLLIFPKAHAINNGIWYADGELGYQNGYTGIFSLPDPTIFTDFAEATINFGSVTGTSTPWETTLLGAVMSLNHVPSWPTRGKMPRDYKDRSQQITLVNGNNDDVWIDSGLVRITGPTGAFTITGFRAPPHVKEFTLYHVLSQPLTIAHNASPLGENRIYTGAGDLTTTNSGAFRFIRSNVDKRWILCGREL